MKENAADPRKPHRHDFPGSMTFLNPILKIGIQMTEGIRKHQNCSKKEAEAKAIELMRQVGIPSPENGSISIRSNFPAV